MKIIVFKKWSKCSDKEKLEKLRQGAIWTNINVLLTIIIVDIIILLILW